MQAESTNNNNNQLAVYDPQNNNNEIVVADKAAWGPWLVQKANDGICYLTGTAAERVFQPLAEKAILDQHTGVIGKLITGPIAVKTMRPMLEKAAPYVGMAINYGSGFIISGTFYVAGFMYDLGKYIYRNQQWLNANLEYDPNADTGMNYEYDELLFLNRDQLKVLQLESKIKDLEAQLLNASSNENHYHFDVLKFFANKGIPNNSVLDPIDEDGQPRVMDITDADID